MDMQITPIIPTTDALIGEVVGAVKAIGKWLLNRMVDALCVHIYSEYAIIPCRPLGSREHALGGPYSPVMTKGFFWFSAGIGLGYIDILSKKYYGIPSEKKDPGLLGFMAVSPGYANNWATCLQVTLPRWKIKKYEAEWLRLVKRHNERTQRARETFDYSANILAFVAAVRKWDSARQWFDERKIPYTLGAVFFGPPGSGKTTLVTKIAAEMGRKVLRANLKSKEDLYKSLQVSVDAIEASYEGSCLWLIEDIDAVFNKRQNVSKESSLTFDDLLNLLSGVALYPARVVIITTNHPEELDPALAHIPTDGSPPVPRPGRIDHIVYVGPLDKEARERVVARVFPDRPDLWHDLVVAGEGETIALFQARCVTLALELKAKVNQ
mgnify:CR=1 FL=1